MKGKEQFNNYAVNLRKKDQTKKDQKPTEI